MIFANNASEFSTGGNTIRALFAYWIEFSSASEMAWGNVSGFAIWQAFASFKARVFG